MRFRKTPTFLILATPLFFAQPAWARQKPVAPTFRSARADVAASLPRHGGVKPPLRYAALKDGATTATSAKPFSQELVVSMVRDGFGDESGAKLIEQRGIDFTPSEDFYQSLKAAGASEAFLKALRAAKRPEPASAKKPLNQVQVFALLAGQVPSHRVTMLVQERGIDFEPTNDYLQEVRLAGGEDELISALKSAKVTKPVTVDPAAEARQAEVRHHVARGAELIRRGLDAEAESEYSAAIRIDPQNVEAHLLLGVLLGNRGDIDGEIAEEREAVRLKPQDALGHGFLGVALGQKGDLDGDIAEEREALRLDPDSGSAHTDLGLALGGKRDWDGAIAEEREALRIDPQNSKAHLLLGAAFGVKGDVDGEIAEYRETLRLDPANARAHYLLGNALERKHDLRDALHEYHTAYTLDPKGVAYKQNYEHLLQQSDK
jgi:tetratricopeptide (TPR) repeat protein